MIQQLDITNEATALAIHKLQKLAYQIEADLIKDNEIPYLTQSLSDLMREDEETFWGYFDDEDNRLLGCVSFKIVNEGVLDMHRYMVHPAAFRQGIAHKLFLHLEQTYLLRKVIAQTGAQNKPAINFYPKMGVAFVCNIQVNRNIELATFEKVYHALEEYRKLYEANGQSYLK